MRLFFFKRVKAIVKLNHYRIEITQNVLLLPRRENCCFPFIRSIILIASLFPWFLVRKWLDKLPDCCHSYPITDRQSVPDCRRLRPFHKHLIVGLKQLHFLNGNVIVKQIFHFHKRSHENVSIWVQTISFQCLYELNIELMFFTLAF